MSSFPMSNMGTGGMSNMGGGMGGGYSGANSMASNGLSPNQNQVSTKAPPTYCIAVILSTLAKVLCL